MRLLSIGDEPGFFAFGQFATGVIAVGQVATGVIAVGQVARGVVAVGQLGIGLLAAGQLCAGVFGGAGIGIAGRGKGFVLSLVPTIEPAYAFPLCVSFADAQASHGDAWVEASLSDRGSGHVGLAVGEQVLPVKLACTLVTKARTELMRFGGAPVIAHLRNMGEVLVCDRLIHVPSAVGSRPGFWIGLVLRMALLSAVAVVVWVVALLPALRVLFQVI